MKPQPTPTPVAIAIIHLGDQVLVRRRPDAVGSPMPGYWEFPGGKCHPGESPDQCAIRECREETGLVILTTGLRRVVEHDYPHGLVRLHFYDCRLADQSPPRPPTGGFVWVDRAALGDLQFPWANRMVVQELLDSRT